MEMTLSKNKYKDELPENTIKKIRDILQDIGVHIYEYKWEEIENNSYSVYIRVEGIQHIEIRGKGATRLYCLASAYGELMERLQNGWLIPFIYENGYLGKNPVPNEKIISIQQLYESRGHILNSVFCKNLSESELNKIIHSPLKEVHCRAFYHVNSKKVDYLPYHIIEQATSTNGLCAGNTSREALVHGLCEIIERYVTKCIISNKLLLPTIYHDKLQEYPCYQLIDRLKKKGFTIIIKDCTLGGNFPVLGVLFINLEKSCYNFRLGCDPNLEIALERCLTEMFMGKSFNELTNLPFKLEWKTKYRQKDIPDILNGNGEFPDSILVHVTEDKNYKNAFIQNYKNNKQGLMHLSNLIQSQGFEIYIRDASFLNFPSYYIYIPGMSEMHHLDLTKLTHLRNRFDLRNIINYKNFTIHEFEQLLDEIGRVIYSDSLTMSDFLRHRSIYLKSGYMFNEFDLRLFISLVYNKLNNYKKSLFYLKSYISNIEIDQYQNVDYYLCASAFLKFKVDGLADIDILTILSPIYGDMLSNEIIDDLGENADIFKYLDEPKLDEQHYSLMQKISNTLTNEYSKKPIDQMEIAQIFVK